MKKVLGVLSLCLMLSGSAQAFVALAGAGEAPAYLGIGDLLSTTTTLPTMIVLDNGEAKTAEELIAAATEEAQEGTLGANIEVLAEELDVDAADLFVTLQESAE